MAGQGAGNQDTMADPAVELVQQAVEAHGGLARWRQTELITARCRSGSLALATKLRLRAFRRYEARISTRAPRVVIAPYGGAGRRGVLDGRTVRIEREDGRVLVERADAHLRFARRGGRVRRMVYWDRLDVLYVTAYTLWNHFTVPFLLFDPEFEFRIGRGWEEGEEIWRRLHVHFPPHLPTHSHRQSFYFDPKGLLRRVDCVAEVFGQWARVAHFCSEHETVSGLVFPTRRREVPRDAEGFPRRGPTLAWMEVDEIAVGDASAPTASAPAASGPA